MAALQLLHRSARGSPVVWSWSAHSPPEVFTEVLGFGSCLQIMHRPPCSAEVCSIMLGVHPLGIFSLPVVATSKSRLRFCRTASQTLQLRFFLRFSGVRGCPLRQWVAKGFTGGVSFDYNHCTMKP